MQGITGTAVRIHSGTSFPPSPHAGDAFYRTDLREFYVYDGTSWVRWEIETHASEHQAGGADDLESLLRLANLAERSHSSLTGIGPSDHHVKTTSLADITDHDLAHHALGTVVPHDALANLTERSHNSLTDVTPDQHHSENHHARHESGGADKIRNMELDNAPGTNDTGSGLVTVGTVGETVAAGDVLYLKADGKYYKALATGTATMPAKVLAMEPISANASGRLLHLGYFRHDAWSFTVGNGTANLLYVDRTTPGLVTQTAPSTTGDQVQVIGYCVATNIIFFNPCLELVEIS